MFKKSLFGTKLVQTIILFSYNRIGIGVVEV